MKFLQSIKEKLKMPVVFIPEQDVAILAMMCDYCNPKIRKPGLIDSYYAYYVPQYPEDIDIVKSIFERNGIHMEKHLSHVFGKDVCTVLRVKLNRVWNKNVIRNEMKKIEQKHSVLYFYAKQQEKTRLQKQIVDLRQKQK